MSTIARTTYMSERLYLETFCEEKVGMSVEVMTEQYPVVVRFTPSSQMSLFSDLDENTDENGEINCMPVVDVPEWIPVKWRELTDEEQKEYASYDYKVMADFRIPEDGEEILICSKRGYVTAVVFCFDDFGIGDEQGNDWLEDVVAWMPFPKPYKKVKAE